MKKLERFSVTVLYLAKSPIGIVMIDSPRLERVSMSCKVAISRKSDLLNCQRCTKVLDNHYAHSHVPLPVSFVHILASSTTHV